MSSSVEDYRHGSDQCVGVLVTNLGTPDAPTPAALRRYLAEFLWDRRVVDLPRPLWWLILHLVILRIRPRRSARLYEKVWTAEGSPLLAISRKQASGLRDRLQSSLPGPVCVELGMRYGQPSIGEAMRSLRSAGARRLLILPLYPQYAASTTASTFDAVAEELVSWPWVPELRFVAGYHQDDGYLNAVADSLRRAWREQAPSKHLLLSFHGVPRRYLLQGDPYHCFCVATGREITKRLGLNQSEWTVTFQSRFGREEWLRPYTDETLQRLAAEGVRSVDVVCPGFSADCLETLEEIEYENKAQFVAAGGEHLRYIPALNDDSQHLDALAEMVRRELQGWPEADGSINQEELARAAVEARQRALELGAEA